ncbi:MAG: hypothetical protein ACKVYV_03460 [Limisphaerales bacterium]
MPDNTQQINRLLSVVLAVATAALGFITLRERLSSARPPEKHVSEPGLTGDQGIVARPWEDPLEAVRSQAANMPPGSLARLNERIAQRHSAPAQTAYLLVTVPGLGFPEDAEVRLRTRLAVQTALARDGFIAEDRNHLGAVPLVWPARLQLEGGSVSNAVGLEVSAPVPAGHAAGDARVTALEARAFAAAERVTAALQPASSRPRTLTVAYEWFSAPQRPDGTTNTTAPGGVQHALVLWLPEDEIGDQPLGRLTLAVDQIDPRAERCGREEDALPRVVWVGPRSSDTLRALLTRPGQIYSPPAGQVDAGHFRGRCDPIRLSERLTIVSPQATAPDRAVGLTNPPAGGRARAGANELLLEQLKAQDRTRQAFVNLIATDDELAALLVSELSLRGVDAGESGRAGRDFIVLVTEADTSYGRSFPPVMQAALLDRHERGEAAGPGGPGLAAKIEALSQGRATPPRNVVVFRYLRGLDGRKGRAEGAAAKGEARPRSPEETLEAALRGQSEFPEGEAQFDYAERLARLLAGLDRHLRRRGAGRVAAVGVLGGDVYDKLILLQALHRPLHGAVFFTTDLDARLWHPGQYRYTRNLLVASAWDVQLEEHLDALPGRQHLLAPFRDGYQRAVYEAVRSGLHAAGLGPDGDVFTAAPAAQMYELGRRGPVKLVPAGEPSQDHLGTRTQRFVAALFRAGKPSQDNLGYHYSGRVMLTLGLFALSAAFLILHLRSAQLMVGAMLQVCRPSRWRVLGSGGTSGAIREARVGLVGWLLLAGGGVFAFAFVLGPWLARQPGGEPWAWWDGISAWPTQVLRLGTILLTLGFLATAWFRHRLQRLRMWTRCFGAARTYSEPRVDLRQLLDPATRRGYWRQHVSLESWELASPTGPAAPSPWETGTLAWRPGDHVDALALYQSYLSRAQFTHRMLRVLPQAAGYVALGTAFVLLAGGVPETPIVRGGLARGVDAVLLWTQVALFSVLLFYVFDAVRMTARMLERLATAPTVWPSEVVKDEAGRLGVEPRHLEGWLDVEFAAEKTKETSQLIILPFIVLGLMLVSRSGFFDDWTWPPRLVVVFGLSFVLALAVSRAVRRAAREVKAAALAGVERALSAARSGAKDESSPALAALKELRARIEQEGRGAYSGFVQDPALLAVLIPTGGLGLLVVGVKLLFGVQ